MTIIMQIYLTILISIIFIMILTSVIACIFSGSYYYEKISDVCYAIFKTSILLLVIWGCYIGVACIWRWY